MHLLAIGLSLLALGTTSNVAPCQKAMIGHGPADWRGESVVAGPLGVRRGALGAMSRFANGLVAKMQGLELGPACEQCGGMMQRTGSCYTCSSCGNNTGCG